MIEKEYPVSFEVEGPIAMFARPDTGAAPVSYPVPTKSALKGMFESVAFSKYAYFEPKRVEICSPIVYRRYTTNYRGPLKKISTQNFQLIVTVLENVCYKVYGVILSYSPPRKGENHQHKLQELFMRRLRLGQFYTTPYLGWKEFVPTYFGCIRDNTETDKSINLIIPSMLTTMYDRPTDGNVSPQYEQEIKIEGGVMFC